MNFVSEKNLATKKAIDAVNVYITNINLYSDKLNQLRGDVSFFLTSTLDLIKYVTDPEKATNPDGLLVDLNCLFLDQGFERIYDGVCVSFVSALYNLTKVIIVFSFSLFFGSFFLFCTALRNARPLEENP
jgi:hypothetical protein